MNHTYTEQNHGVDLMSGKVFNSSKRGKGNTQLIRGNIGGYEVQNEINDASQTIRKRIR